MLTTMLGVFFTSILPRRLGAALWGTVSLREKKMKTLHFRRDSSGLAVNPSRGWQWHSSPSVWGSSVGISSFHCHCPHPLGSPERHRLPSGRDSPVSCSLFPYTPLGSFFFLILSSFCIPHRVQQQTWNLCVDSHTPFFNKLIPSFSFHSSKVTWIKRQLERCSYNSFQYQCRFVQLCRESLYQ